MADETEKFVLLYQVQMSDAIARLEQLDRRVNNVNRGAGRAGEEFKRFSTGAADEIGKLIPGIDRISGAVGIMTGGFVAATSAVAVLAAGVKSVMDLREQYGKQRLAGMSAGTSAVQLEEYERKIVKNSDGNVTKEGARGQITSLANRLQSAYADPSRLGADAKMFKLAGINIGEIGKPMAKINDVMTQLAVNLSKMSPGKAQGSARAFGIDENFALTLHKLGAEIGSVTEQTEAEVNKRIEAERVLTRFNDQLAKMNQTFNELEMSLGQKLLPSFNNLLELINKVVNAIPNAAAKARNFGGTKDKKGIDLIANAEKAAGTRAGQLAMQLNPLTALANGSHKLGGWLAKTFDIGGDERRAENKEKFGNTSGKGVIQRDADGKVLEQVTNETNKKLVGGIKSVFDEAAAQNEEAAEQAAKMTMAINMFAGAVATFANAIDNRQAWAAWAGIIGTDSGLDGPKASEGVTIANPYDRAREAARAASDYANAPAAGQNPNAIGTGKAMGPTQYDELFAAAERANGLPAGTLKNMARVESEFNPNAVSESGAEGLLQIMPANKKALGIKDSFDPAQNIAGAGRLMKENLAATNGDMHDALRMYHAGPNREGWGPRTNAYPYKVMGYDDGDGKASLNKLQTKFGGPVQPEDRRINKLLKADNEEITRNNQVVGESRESMQKLAVQQNIAGRLGVPVDQLQHGGVSKGDAGFAASQMQAGIKNQIFNLKKELTALNLPPTTRMKLENEVREQTTGLALMEKYSPEIVNKQAEGGRSITIGERAIVINLNDLKDPKANATAIYDEIQSNVNDLANDAANGIKY